MKITEGLLRANGWERQKSFARYFKNIPCTVMRISVTFGTGGVFYATLWLLNENTTLKNIRTMEELSLLVSLLRVPDTVAAPASQETKTP